MNRLEDWQARLLSSCLLNFMVIFCLLNHLITLELTGANCEIDEIPQSTDLRKKPVLCKV